ncbi:hypothetical protein LOTGIDRAFT_151942 [Lottia gigantea]|uniref:Uncharacterized protein n=1 Tax=Lottia gigantea TaxID=225164 RepID=V4BBZ9_LOTGI|nr:hypothetical protein LOTGIDRAFT_151942 [Lottia gigantea]ESP05141.1 hypothetical protein LOTGIDRAFT_151942 [Lottia gigantea]
MPDDVNKTLSKLMLEFLWNNKPPSIQYKSVINHKFNGGLGFPDIQSKSYAFALKWLKKLLDPSQCHIWKSVINYFVTEHGNSNATDIFKLYFSKSFIRKLPPFYQVMFNGWDVITQFKRPAPQNLYEMSIQPLFNNPFIVRNNKVLKCDLFSKCGINTIYDIIYYYGISSFLPLSSLLEDCVECEPNPDYVEKMFEIIKSSIPTEWKIIIESETYSNKDAPKPYLLLDDEKIGFDNFTTKFLYKVLLERKAVKPTGFLYWEHNLKKELNWSVTCKNVVDSYKDCKILS